MGISDDDGGGARKVRHLDIVLDRDLFLRKLVRHLSGTFEEVIGLREISGVLGVVGQKLGDEIDRAYREALGVPRLLRAQVSEVLGDVKRRIGGEFRVIEESDEKIVLGGTACPFLDEVRERPSMCMITSNVFGSITAQNLGYARVVVEAAIATGSDGCRVAIHLQPALPEGAPVEGRESFRGS